MNIKIDISATIVLYENDVDILKKTIDSFLNTSLSKKLYLIDNSPTNVLESEFNHPDIEYSFVGKNLGFGKAHNLVLEKIKNTSNYHLVLNPDVWFDVEVIPKLITALENSNEVTMIAPKVLYPDGKYQYTCRKHPTFLELISRRLNILKNYTFSHEYRNLDLSKTFSPDFIHGCFYIFKTKDFVNLKGFDERYFLYMEDADICRKIDKTGKKKLYFPDVAITHIHKKDSSKSLKLFFTHLNSSFKYFKKWGVTMLPNS